MNGPAKVAVRRAEDRDAEAIRLIYNHEVEHSTVTFDLVARTAEEQAEWMDQHRGALAALVAEVDGEVVGFASLSAYRPKPAYRTTVEDSIYVAESARGLGVGRLLLAELVQTATASGFHTVMAHIVGGHEASIALHRDCGFEVVGTQREVGRKFGTWLDVVMMQRVLQ